MTIQTVKNRLAKVYWQARIIPDWCFNQIRFHTQGTYQLTHHHIGRLEKAEIDSYRRKLPVRITSTFDKEDPRALLSHTRDAVFAQLLETGGFTFDKLSYIKNPYRYAALTALVLFRTEEPCAVRFHIPGEDGAAEVSNTTGVTCAHRVFIYGLHPHRENDVTLELIGTDGAVLRSRTISIKAGKLPNSLRSMLLEKNFQKPSAADLLFITGGEMYPFAFDTNGEIRYYLKANTSNYGVFPLTRSRLLWGEHKVSAPSFAHAHSSRIQEIDAMGRVHRTYLMENGMHHFATELPNGNIVGISSTMDGATEDCLIEIDRKTGQLVQTIDMRFFFGDEYRDMIDWVHPNALQYFPDEDCMMVCLRNVHSVLKFNWTTKEVIWLLSIPEFWKGHPLEDKVLAPEGKIRWNYQAHAAYELAHADGQESFIRRILVFDNHAVNRRPCKQFNKSKHHSFVNIFEVNEREHTVRLEKQFTIPYSSIRSNARYDAKSGRVFAFEGCLDRKLTEKRGQVLELDYESGETINSCAVAKDFFSGYPFALDYRALEEPMDYNRDYMCNNLTPPAAIAAEALPALTQQKLPKLVILNLVIIEDSLFFRAKDHDIQKLFFVGEQNRYVKDYTNTHQTMELHANRIYYCTVTLEKMEMDTYHLYAQYKDQIYQIRGSIRIER